MRTGCASCCRRLPRRRRPRCRQTSRPCPPRSPPSASAVIRHAMSPPSLWFIFILDSTFGTGTLCLVSAGKGSTVYMRWCTMHFGIRAMSAVDSIVHALSCCSCRIYVCCAGHCQHIHAAPRPARVADAGRAWPRRHHLAEPWVSRTSNNICRSEFAPCHGVPQQQVHHGLRFTMVPQPSTMRPRLRPCVLFLFRPCIWHFC